MLVSKAKCWGFESLFSWKINFIFKMIKKIILFIVIVAIGYLFFGNVSNFFSQVLKYWNQNWDKKVKWRYKKSEKRRIKLEYSQVVRRPFLARGSKVRVLLLQFKGQSGEIGRHAGFRFQFFGIGVQVPSLVNANN